MFFLLFFGHNIGCRPARLRFGSEVLLLAPQSTLQFVVDLHAEIETGRLFGVILDQNQLHVELYRSLMNEYLSLPTSTKYVGDFICDCHFSLHLARDDGRLIQ